MSGNGNGWMISDDRFRRLRNRYDTEANWSADNPYLAVHEIGVVLLDGESVASKIGPGYWSELPWFTNIENGGGGGGSPDWSSIINKPATFPPVIGAGAADAVAGNDSRLTDAQSHITANNNPHSTTKAQVGLGNCDNTSDADKPVSTAQAAADAVVRAAAWPIGSVFISVVSTNPATLLGFGTWSAFATGRTLVGLDGGQTEFDTVEETGGAKTVAASGTVSTPTASGCAVADHASHTHGVTSNVTVGDHASHTHSVTSNVTVTDHASHTHTYTDVPNHVHVHNIQGGTTGTTTGTFVMGSTAAGGSARAPGNAMSNNTGGVATGTTAGPSATLTHAVTNNAVTSGNPSATLTHSVVNNAVTSAGPSATLTHAVTQPTISQPIFTGGQTSVLQPYITVFMWKRTA